jgi:uncharacterized protein YrrD
MKSSSTAGIPICLTTGEQLATVKLAVFDPQQHQTLGFLVEWGGWAGSAKVLPWSKRVSVSEKSIEIASASQIVPASQAPRMQSILVGSSLSRGTLIATADGRIAGTLHDVHFDPQTGAIRGYELVFAKGETAGQHVLLSPDQVQYDPAESVLVVPAVTDAQIQESAHYRD